jgi:hypothetical protein
MRYMAQASCCCSRPVQWHSGHHHRFHRWYLIRTQVAHLFYPRLRQFRSRLRRTFTQDRTSRALIKSSIRHWVFFITSDGIITCGSPRLAEEGQELARPEVFLDIAG